MRKTAIILFTSIMIFIPISGFTQHVYTIDASDAMVHPETGLFRMGDPGPEEKEIMVNSQYLTIGGKPVLPVMGEVHFSRIKHDQWEDVILKMKAGGINIVSTYLFWNHHEEIEGQFCWEGDKDLRAFLILCRQHGMYAYPRMGPWSHGEVRNGGTPDWVLRKRYITDRSNDVVYQTYVTRYFSQIAGQLDGLLYKDGGPVIGIQLENEYWFAKEGEPHIQWLKNTARKLGIDVPLYTVTGWGDGSVPPFEVIPMWGGYADEPWIQNVQKNILRWNFKFDAFHKSKRNGNDQVSSKDEYMSYEKYPYFTCEMGVGIQNTYHRRLCIGKIDGLGMMLAKLGSGSNLLGYYMFAGGTNPHGEIHSTGEEQEETGYWSRVPVKSYDFQATIGESGMPGPSYNQVKKLHYFVNEFGSLLAPMNPVLGKTGEDELQLSVRSDNQSGFLFGINYCRFVPMEERKNVRFSIKFTDGIIEFPQKGINIPDSTFFIWPLNFNIEGSQLKYATAQLLTKIDDTYVFYQNNTISPEFAFDTRTIKEIRVSAGKVERKNNLTLVTDLRPGTDCFISIIPNDGKVIKILVLTGEQSENAWVLERNNRKEFYISKAVMYVNQDDIYAFVTAGELQVLRLTDTGFKATGYTLKPAISEVKITPHPLFEEAAWLESANFKDLPAYMERYHRFFYKEFSLENPSPVRKATLFVFPESTCMLNINEKWIRQDVKPAVVNDIDLTGYVQKGNNLLFMDFPYLEGQKKFAARLVVEYSNFDRVEFVTDASWLQTDMYTHPSNMRPYDKPQPAIIVSAPAQAPQLAFKGFAEWDISVPRHATGNSPAVYLTIDYLGDRAEIYNGHVLCADDFNNNTPWTIGLQRISPPVEGKKLKLVVYPLSRDSKIYFDIPADEKDYERAAIRSWDQKAEIKFKIE